MFWYAAFLSLICSLVLGTRATAQQPIAEHHLSAAYRTYAEQCTDIGYALPLDNGSLMVADFGEMTLWRLDGRTGTARAVGRKGSGPNEYQVAGQLLRLPGDTVAMYDAALARMLLVTAAGDPIRTVTLTTNRLEILTLPQPFAADAGGRIYAHVFARQRGTSVSTGSTTQRRRPHVYPGLSRRIGASMSHVLDANGRRVVRHRLPANARFSAASNDFIFLSADELETVVAYRAR